MQFHLRALWGEIDKDGIVNYWLDDTTGNKVDFNDFVGKKLIISDTGTKKCRICGKETDQIFNKGTCASCFRTSPRSDICMIKPELCHFAAGTCRDEDFAKQWCFNNQLIYFSLTSGPKVGYLSLENYPQRWIDQGATRAIVVAKANSRLEAGEIETYLAQFMNDKTNWSAMLKGKILEDCDLLALKNKWAKRIEDRWPERVTDDQKIVELNFPVQKYPEKISSAEFDKNGEFSGVLMGIRGQYLIFKDKVFSIKKHEGYIVDITVEDPEEIEIVSQGSLF